MDEPNINEGGNEGLTSEVVRENQQLVPSSTVTPPSGPEGSITWSASEFIAHRKGPLWYVLIILVPAAIAVLFWLLTKDKITSGTILLVGIVLAIFGSKQPKDQSYKIDSNGISIGEKQHSFNDFRSFAIVRQGAFSSLVFVPLKRFGLLTTANYDPQDEQKIVALLSSYLPLEESHHDILEELMWKIKF